MDVRKRIPKGRSGQLAINLRDMLWMEIRNNPEMSYEDVNNYTRKIKSMNKIIERRSIGFETVKEIRNDFFYGKSVDEIKKAYKLPMKLVMKIVNNQI